MSNSPLLQLRQLTIGYKNRPLLRQINTRVASGQLICLLGRNGSGKSTLLRTLAGAHQPLSGEVLLSGQPLHSISARQRARCIAVVFTTALVASRLTVRELVALGRYPYTSLFGRLAASDRHQVMYAMEACHCSQWQDVPVNELSDGQRQRVMVARALAQQPSLMLLDEPTAFLDMPARREIAFLLKELVKTKRLTVIMAIHDLELATSISDTFWLAGAQGQFDTGYPEDLLLTGSLDRLTGQPLVFTNHDYASFQVHVAGDAAVARYLKKALYREGFQVAPEAAGAAAIITAQPGGKSYELHTGQDKMSFPTIHSLMEYLKDRAPSDGPNLS